MDGLNAENHHVFSWRCLGQKWGVCMELRRGQRSAVPELLQPVTIVGVNSVECQFERWIRFSCEAQNFVGFFGPNEFPSLDLPSESSRVT